MKSRSREIEELVGAIEKLKDIIGQEDEGNSVLNGTLDSNLKLLHERLFEKVQEQFHKTKKITQRKKLTNESIRTSSN